MIDAQGAQQPDHVRTGIVALVGLGVVVVTAVLVAIAWWLVAAPPAANVSTVTRPSVLQRELFDRAAGGADSRAAGARALEQTQWVDRSAQLARIPIERAIDAVVADPALLAPSPSPSPKAAP